MKTCTKCGQAKELSEFGRKKDRDAHNSICKACHTAHVIAYCTAHPEQSRERRRQYEKKRMKHADDDDVRGGSLKWKFQPYQAKPTLTDLHAIPRDSEGNRKFLNALLEMPSLPESYIKFAFSEAPHRPSIYEDLIRLATQHDPAHVKQQL